MRMIALLLFPMVLLIVFSPSIIDYLITTGIIKNVFRMAFIFAMVFILFIAPQL